MDNEADGNREHPSPSFQGGAVGPEAPGLNQALEVIRTGGTLNVEEKILTTIGSMSVKGNVNSGLLNQGQVNFYTKPPGTDDDSITGTELSTQNPATHVHYNRHEHSAAAIAGAGATAHFTNSTINIVGSVGSLTLGQGNEKVPDITGNEDEDVKEFLEVVNNHTLKRIQYDICENRINLKKLTEHTQPELMVINMDGRKGCEMDDGSAKAEREKQGPIGTDVAETYLNDLHKKNGESEVRHVLLIGSAGEGKTNTAKRYAFLVRDASEPSLKHIELVLYIPLSDVDTEKSTPIDLLVTKQLGKLDERLKRAGKKWLEENSDKTMIIFDGLDQSKFSLQHCSAKTNHEASTTPEVIIANILSGHIYSGMKILSTSRWHSFWTLGNDLKPDRVVALRGFSEVQIKDLFRKLIGTNADSVLHHIQEKAPGLLPLCSTPNILLNTASVLLQSPEIRPETQSAILTHIVKYLLRSDNRRNTDPNLVVNLSKLAYHSIAEDIFMFRPSYLRKFGLQISDIHDFTSTDAILVPDQDKVLEGDQRCSFYHQTIQMQRTLSAEAVTVAVGDVMCALELSTGRAEITVDGAEYFAALHICIENDEFHSFVENIFEDSKMENVLIFLSGILAHEKTFKTVQNHILNVEISINQMRDNLSDMFSGNLHGPVISDVKLCRVMQDCDKNFVEKSTANVTEIRINDFLEPRDGYIVSSMVSKLTNLEVVQLTNLELNPSTTRVLAGKINSIRIFKVNHLFLNSSLSDQHKSDIEKILNNCEFSWIILNCGDDVARFSLACVKGRKIDTVETRRNKNLDHDTYRLISAAAPSNLYIEDNDLQDEDINQLLVGVEESAAKMNALFLDENKNLTEQGFFLVAEIIAQGQPKQIFLRDCNLNEKKVKALHDDLEGQELEVEVMSINRNKTMEPTAFQYVPGLIAVGRVQEFQMEDCGLTTEDLEVFEEHAAAHKHVKLRKFAIGGNTSIQPGGYRLVINILQHFSVQILMLSKCGLNAEKIRELANEVVGKHLPLQEIIIDENKNIGSEGFKLLVDFMLHTLLQLLQMVDCDLDPENLKAMADQAEGKQLELKDIIVDKNRNIGLDGCKHLVDFLKQTQVIRLSMGDCRITSDMLKSLILQLKSRNVKIPELGVSENIPSDSRYLDLLVELISTADSKVVWMDNCNLTVAHMESLCRNLIEKSVTLEALGLSQNAPDAVKGYLPSICQLFHCVSGWINLHKWKFDEQDQMLLKAELQKCPFQNLKVEIFDDSGDVIILKKEKRDTSDEDTSDENEKEATTSKPKNKSRLRGFFRRLFRR